MATSQMNSVSQLITPTSLRSSSKSTTRWRSEEHTSELQSQSNLVCRLLLEKKKIIMLLPASGLLNFVHEYLFNPTDTSPGSTQVYHDSGLPLSCSLPLATDVVHAVRASLHV